MKEILTSERLPKPRFLYSPLIKTGHYYQTAGMIALDIESGKLEPGGVKSETEKILNNLTNALPDFGLTLEDLVIARIYTTGFSNFSEINIAWEEIFTDKATLPARTAVGVSQLPLDASVEMEFTFYKNIFGDIELLNDNLEGTMSTPRNNSVVRTFDILCCFDEGHPELTVNEIAKSTNISAATVHRFLLTLKEIGVVVRNVNGSYQLGMLIADLGGQILQGNALYNALQPYIEPLAEKFNETVHVAILTGDWAYYVGKGESRRSLRIDTHVGKQLPAYCSALGKVLLSGLSDEALESYLERTELKQFTHRTITTPDVLRLAIEKIKQQGFGIDDEEIEEGLRCIAVPIYNYHERVMAAISVSGPTTRLNWKSTAGYVKKLTVTAQLIFQKAYPQKIVLDKDS